MGADVHSSVVDFKDMGRFFFTGFVKYYLEFGPKVQKQGRICTKF